VGIILFNPSKKEINKYETEINNLNKKNKELLFKNDSLKNVNRQLGNDILILTKKIDDINIELEDNENLIKRLKKKKGEIFSNVNSMDANGVTRSLTDYLKRRD
jgi:chromosome segregation ATPase